QFLLENLRDLGYVEGQNVVVEFRDLGDSTEESTDAAELAAELVALPVDIIATFGLTALRSASAATSTIPIVNASGGGDLVQLGLADSLAHPGRNVTVVTFTADRLHGKGLQLLTEVAAPAARVAVLLDGRNPRAATMREQFADHARP